ncbi:MAG TPA: glycine zipper domain-containing protein [Syntrophobacteria bacterium]|nr:glycine zipper domain-containing protein [Syntrophobacteria bacterium]
MRGMMGVLVLLLAATLVAGPALAQDFVIYPAKGQSQEQMEKDKFECYSWAKKQSGFDPMETPKATAPPPPKQAQSSVAGGALKGGAGGALVGLGIGAIAGNAGKGAAIGAVSGGAIGGIRSHRQQKQDEQAQQQWAQEQASQYQQLRSAYNRAYSACLEGKGYTVK